MSSESSSDAEYLMRKYDEDIANRVQFLAHGNAKDYAEYRQVCGIIRGLESAKQYIVDLAKRHEDAND